MSTITKTEKFLINKIIIDFKNYDLVDDEIIKEISTYKYSDKFRDIIKFEEIEQILDFIESDKDPNVRFGHLLLRPFLNENEDVIKPWLTDRWESFKNPINKIGLIFDLLEYKDVATKDNENFFNFLESNWGAFKKYELDWYGGESNLLLAVERRLDSLPKDKGYKKWIYLYLLSLVKQDKFKAIEIIKKYFNDSDDFINIVKKRVLETLAYEKINFWDFYQDSYKLLKHMLKEHINLNSKILDMGCGKAEYLKKYFNNSSIKFLLVDKEYYDFDSKNVFFKNEDVNNIDLFEYLNVSDFKINLIIINAAIHEFWCGDKINYVKKFFERIFKILPVGGRCYLGDYYYMNNIPKKKFEKYSKSLISQIGHADSMERFVNPSSLLNIINNGLKFKLLEFKEIRVTDEIDRFYYGLLIEKIK